jgi:Xaa-Pro aminopeptidase
MSRADRVEARLEVDALLVTDPVNIRYLTGFTGTNAMCVVGPGIRRFITDSRYVQRAALEVSGFDQELAPQEFLAALSDGWASGRLRLGFEDHKLPVRRHKRISELLPESIELVPAGGAVEAERALKEPEEIEAIAVAAALADEALLEVLDEKLSGRTERAVALAIEDAMRRRGAEPAFATIVASGANGASPHASPGDTEIAPGVLVTIDFGAKLDGYNSDCTRTYACGELPDELLELYELVRIAQEEALEALAPGVGGSEADAVARDRITAAGHGEHFGHGLGHGLGLEVHEAPQLGRGSEDVLAAGNIVTVEPGVYVPSMGGVRIEDLVEVTAEGGQSLSGLSKELSITG